MDSTERYKNLVLDVYSESSPEKLESFCRDVLDDPSLVLRLDRHASDAPPTHIVKMYHFARYEYFDPLRNRYVFESTDQACEILKDSECIPPFVPEKRYDDFWHVWRWHLCGPVKRYLMTLTPSSAKTLDVKLTESADYNRASNPLYEAARGDCWPEAIRKSRADAAAAQIHAIGAEYTEDSHAKAVTCLKTIPLGSPEVNEAIRQHPVLKLIGTILATMAYLTDKSKDHARGHPVLVRPTEHLIEVLSAMLTRSSLCRRLADPRLSFSCSGHPAFFIRHSVQPCINISILGNPEHFGLPDLTVEVTVNAIGRKWENRGFDREGIDTLVEFVETAIAKFD